MKKAYSFLLFVSILTTINTLAMQPPRPALYDLLDPLMANLRQTDWSAIFTVLDKIQGTLSVNGYRTPQENLSLLDVAVRNRNLLAAKKLLEEYGADPNIPTSINKTSLLITAIFNRDLPMIQLLLKYKANPYAADINGDDSFYYANLIGNIRIQELLEAYKSPTIK